MNRKTLKIIGIVAANLPVFLIVVLLICVLSAISGATQKQPEKAPVYAYQSTFRRFDASIIDLDPDGLTDSSNRYFFYSAYLTLFTHIKMSDDMVDSLVDKGYKPNDTGDGYAAITDDSKLLENLNSFTPITDEQKQTILTQRDNLKAMMPGKYVVPLLDPDFLSHIVKEFGNGQKGVTVAFSGIENLSARAIDDGVVTETGYSIEYGNYVLIQHTDGLQSLYGHLYECTVKTGESVQVGCSLGVISDSGMTDTPSLYFEMRKNSLPVNPKPYFKG